jgi:hypothetical protein
MKLEERIKKGIHFEKLLANHEIEYINNRSLSVLVSFLKENNARF